MNTSVRNTCKCVNKTKMTDELDALSKIHYASIIFDTMQSCNVFNIFKDLKI